MNNSVAKLDHINFSVENFEDTVDWYNKVFHFELVEKGVNIYGRKWGILKSGDSMLAITELPQRKWNESGEFHKTFHFALRLQDKKEWEKTVNKYRLKLSDESPVSYPFSTSWYVQDPTGYSIEVTIWDDNKVRFPQPESA